MSDELMGDGAKKRKQIVLRVDPELKSRIDSVAEQNGLSVNRLLVTMARLVLSNADSISRLVSVARLKRNGKIVDESGKPVDWKESFSGGDDADSR